MIMFVPAHNFVVFNVNRLECNLYYVELQDLSQPKCEASPPDGVLAVPLLRHQVWFSSVLTFTMPRHLLVII